MKLKIRSVADKGLEGKERLVIRVEADTNVGEFVVLRTGFAGGSVNIGVTHTYWFPDKDVRAGDLIVLYTKSGTISEKQLESGAKAHFYYWGERGPLWTAADKAAVLLHAPVWESASPSEL